MADNINFNPQLNRHAFVSVKERPWHGLGTIVEDKMTSSQCIVAAGLDFHVVRVPNYADMYYDRTLVGRLATIEDTPRDKSVDPNGLITRLKPNPKSFTTIRTDLRLQLGTVGADYTVIDNKEAFEFFDTIVGCKEAIYETAGALGNGETIFITAKIPTLINVGNDGLDTVERYIVLSNTHDGSCSLEAFVTTIRVVCNNTLAAARNSASCRFRIRHTKNAKDRIHDARAILKLENDIIEAFALNANTFSRIVIDHQTKVNILADMYLSKDEWVKTALYPNLKDVVSTKKYNLMSEIMGHIEQGPGQTLPSAKDTLWGLYNGVASFYQNGVSYSSQTEKMNKILYGDAYNKVTNAYDSILRAMPALV